MPIHTAVWRYIFIWSGGVLVLCWYFVFFFITVTNITLLNSFVANRYYGYFIFRNKLFRMILFYFVRDNIILKVKRFKNGQGQRKLSVTEFEIVSPRLP